MSGRRAGRRLLTCPSFNFAHISATAAREQQVLHKIFRRQAADKQQTAEQRSVRCTSKIRGFGQVTQPLDGYFSLGCVELRSARGRFRFGHARNPLRCTCASRLNPCPCCSLHLASLRKPFDRTVVEQRGRSGKPTGECSGTRCRPPSKSSRKPCSWFQLRQQTM